eukprot:6779800-Alexandrium_andersonii.AAC.1
MPWQAEPDGSGLGRRLSIWFYQRPASTRVVFALRLACQKSSECECGLIATQVDVRKAFDAISHASIAEGLARRGVDP